MRGSMTRRLTVALLAALCATACTPEGEDGSASATRSAGAESSTASGGHGSVDGSGESGAGAPTLAGSADSGVGSGGASGGQGSEVLPAPTDTPTSLGQLIVDEPAAAVLAVAPPDASDTGLVEGFPSEVILIPDGATVQSSSVSSADGRAQAVLDASVPGGCGDVLITYRGWFGRGGFDETATSEGADRSQLAFARGPESVTLSTITADGSCTVGLLASLVVTG